MKQTNNTKFKKITIKEKERLFQLYNCPESHKNLHHPYSFFNRLLKWIDKEKTKKRRGGNEKKEIVIYGILVKNCISNISKREKRGGGKKRKRGSHKGRTR